MAKLTSFNINTGINGTDLNPAGNGSSAGLEIKGTYSASFSSGGNMNSPEYQVWVSSDGGSTWQQVAPDAVTISWENGNGSASNEDFTINIINTPTVGDIDANSLAHKNVIFQLRQDNSGSSNDVNITETGSTPIAITCFYPGTMIATPNGEVAVEELAIGDVTLRHDGTTALVRWMGRNTVMTRFADPMKALPIRIKKGALAANVPSRDLLVSPDHAMFVDGILAHAGALVNGTSIVRETNVPSTFTYHHIELAEHALVIAENAPAESFIDNVDRMAYDNWAEHEALYGDLPALVEMELPRAKSQRQVPSATRQRLAARAVELGYSAVTSAVA
jgi:hypothetical protein